jgi:hypothetical protein
MLANSSVGVTGRDLLIFSKIFVPSASHYEAGNPAKYVSIVVDSTVLTNFK